MFRLSHPPQNPLMDGKVPLNGGERSKREVKSLMEESLDSTLCNGAGPLSGLSHPLAKVSAGPHP